jgi:tetratricopeptide (TPR) repeat protein
VTMRRMGRIVRWLAFAASAALMIGCSDPRRELQAVPPPDVAGFEPSVRAAITNARVAFDRVVADKPDNARLADAYGELAMTYHAQDLVTPAAIAYANARVLAPSDKRWAYLQGHLFNDSSRVDEAIEAFESAVRIDTGDAPALLALGQVYVQHGDLDKAEATFARLQSDAKTRAAALAGLGKVALTKRDYRRAIDFFEEALKLWPAATRLRQPLATAYQGIGDRAKAEANLRQFAADGGEPSVDDPIADALGDKVAASKVLLRRGQRAGKAGRFDLAEKAFRAAVAADPADAEAIANLGISLANLGRIDEAQERLQQALAMDDSITVAHLSLGVVYDRKGRDQAAIDEYEAALRQDAGNAQARTYLADARMRLGQPLLAAVQYRAALGSGADSTRIRYSLAMAYVKAGRYAEARKVFDEGLAAQPGHQIYINALARILATAPDAAVRDGPRALQLATALFEATHNPDVGLTYAMALAETGHFDEATKLQRETIVAFERSKAEGSKAFMARNLALYGRRQPTREGWPGDDPNFWPRSPAARLAGDGRGS